MIKKTGLIIYQIKKSLKYMKMDSKYINLVSIVLKAKFLDMLFHILKLEL